MSRERVCIALPAMLVAALLLASGCAEQGDTSQTSQSVTAARVQAVSTTTTSAAPVPLAQDGWLLGIPLPTTLSQVVAKLGEPAWLEPPDLETDPNPWGEWSRWRVGDNDFTYSVLNDDYSEEASGSDANVDVVVLRREADVVSPALMDGMMLGLTIRSEVEASFGSSVQPSALAEHLQFDDSEPYASSLVRDQGSVFTFYLFDENNVLVGVVQATYDIGTVE